MRRYGVRVDDPDMRRALDFRVWARSEEAARQRAARKALRREGALPAYPGGPRLSLRWRLRHARAADIVEAVAGYAVGEAMRLRGLGDRIRYSALAGTGKPRVRAKGHRSGSRRRKDRGRRSGVAFCQVLMAVSWETAAGEVVIDPDDKPEAVRLAEGQVRVEYRCGMPFVARRGHARCPAHGSRTR